jgi:hypothetical protein
MELLAQLELASVTAIVKFPLDLYCESNLACPGDRRVFRD